MAYRPTLSVLDKSFHLVDPRGEPLRRKVDNARDSVGHAKWPVCQTCLREVDEFDAGEVFAHNVAKAIVLVRCHGAEDTLAIERNSRDTPIAEYIDQINRHRFFEPLRGETGESGRRIGQ